MSRTATAPKLAVLLIVAALAFVVAGLWADARDRQGLAGVLVGLGCMAKMSPARSAV